MTRAALARDLSGLDASLESIRQEIRRTEQALRVVQVTPERRAASEQQLEIARAYLHQAEGFADQAWACAVMIVRGAHA